MKNRLKFLLLTFTIVAFSCDEQDPITAPSNYVSFEEDAVSVGLPAGESASGQFNVHIVGNASSDRTYNLITSSAAPASSYSIPSTVTIPSGSNSTTVDFSVVDDGGFGLFGEEITVTIEDTPENFIIDEVDVDVAITCDSPVIVDFTFDAYPQETSWELYDANDALLTSGDSYDGLATFSREFCLGTGNYTFVVYDVFGDGICCNYGNGSYSVTIGNTVLASGGSFGASEATSFTIE